MRTKAYGVVIASFLVVLLAFATTPVVAQMTTDPTMEKPGTTEIHKGKMSGEAEKEFSGEAKTGASQEEKARDDMKARMKSEDKSKAAPEPKASVSGEVEGKAKGKVEAEREVGKKPEARSLEEGKKPEAKSFKEKEPGMAERKDVGAAKESREKADVSRQAKTGEAQAKGGEAVVANVDRPDNCLRIRSDASASADIIGCAASGEKLRLTGVFSKDRRWAQLDNNGWVFFDQLQSDVRPPEAMASEGTWERPAAKGDAKPGKRPHRGMPHDFGGSCPGWYPGSYWYGY